MSNYPDNFKGIEGEELETYVYEIHGEIEIEGYSDEDAEIEFEQNLAHHLVNAYRNGDIEIV